MKPEDLGACFERNIARVIVEANENHPAIAKTTSGRLVGLPKVKTLECCCCGDSTRGRQWWNRDTGYGICPKCIAWMREHGTSEAEIADLYGTEHVHFDVDEHADLRQILGEALSK